MPSLPKRAPGTARRAESSRVAIQHLRPQESGYPSRLLSLDRPPALWLAGDPGALSAPLVAIVGSRAAGRKSLELAHELARRLSACGIGVVSGLALGTDGAAHRGCLEGPSPTVAVLGCGLRRLYPDAHRALAREIVAAGGAVISEQDPDTTVKPWMLVRRNHTVCALAQAVVAVESSADGGTMHACRFAIELGRPLWVSRENSGEGGRLLLEAEAGELQRRSKPMKGLRAEGGPFAQAFEDPELLAAKLAGFCATG